MPNDQFATLPEVGRLPHVAPFRGMNSCPSGGRSSRGGGWSRGGCGQASPGAPCRLAAFPLVLVQPHFGNVAWVLFEFATLDLFDDIDEPLVGAGLNADLLAFAHDKATQIFDLGAPALRHTLAHRRPLIG